MKKFLIVFGLLVASQTMWGQSPFAFNFQAVARDLAGNPLINESVDFRLSLLQGSSSGTVVFIEEQSTSSNNFGLANIQVGLGTPVLGTLDALDWANGPYFLQVELDINNGEGYIVMGVSPLTSVPFALHAKTSEQPGPQGEQGLTSLIKTTTIAADAECSEGGTQLEFGVDENQNGLLDELEIDETQTQFICNGTGSSGGGSSSGGSHSAPDLTCNELGAVSYNIDTGSPQVCKPSTSDYSTTAQFLITNELDCNLDQTGAVSNKDYWVSFQVTDSIFAVQLMFEPFATSSFCGNVSGDTKVIYINDVVDGYDPSVDEFGDEILSYSTGALTPFYLIPGRTYLLHAFWPTVTHRMTDVSNYTLNSYFTDVVFYESTSGDTSTIQPTATFPLLYNFGPSYVTGNLVGFIPPPVGLRWQDL